MFILLVLTKRVRVLPIQPFKLIRLSVSAILLPLRNDKLPNKNYVKKTAFIQQFSRCKTFLSNATEIFIPQGNKVQKCS